MMCAERLVIDSAHARVEWLEPSLLGRHRSCFLGRVDARTGYCVQGIGRSGIQAAMRGLS